MTTLVDYIQRNTHQIPDATVQLSPLVRRWLAETGSAKQHRSAVIADVVSAGFRVAANGQGVTVLVGRSLRPATRLNIVDGVARRVRV